MSKLASWVIERLFTRSSAPSRSADATLADELTTLLVSEDLLRRLERLSLRIRRSLPGGPAGEHLGRRSSASVEFADHRSYSPGDDFRRIDWNALARLDQLTIRVTEPREDVGLYLILDCSRSMASGDGAKARLARRLAAALAYVALNQLDMVRIYGLGKGMVARSPRYTGRKQAADVFRLMSNLPVVAATDLLAAFTGFLGDRPAQGLVLVLSDLLTPADYRGGLRRVAQAGFEVAVVHILSDAERTPKLWGDVELVDSETAETLKLSVTPAVLSNYQRDLERWQQEIAAYCHSIGVRYVDVTTEHSLDAILLSDFRRAGLLE